MSKFTKAIHEVVMEPLSIKTAKKTIITTTITIAGLDYVKFKIHHFKRLTKTKAEINPNLSIKPKIIFHAGQHPLQSITVKKQRCKEILELSTNVPDGAPGSVLNVAVPQIPPPL